MDKESKQDQNQRNIDNNANNVKNAADVAIASKNPYAMAAGGAVKLADKVTGGKSTQMIGGALNTAGKMMTGGKMLQNASNKLSESGASDKIGKAASMKSGENQEIPGALKNPNPEGAGYGKRGKGSKSDSGSDSGGLSKKEGLGEKEGLDKKEGKSKSDKGKGKGEGSSSASEENNDLIGVANEKKIKRLKLKIILICVGIFASCMVIFIIVAYFMFVWNTFMTAITSFFGLREGNSVTSENYDPDEDDGGLWVEDKYFKNEGEDVGLTDYEYYDENGEKHVAKGITTVIKEDNICRVSGTLSSWFKDFLTETTGNFDGNVCRLLSYIWGSTSGYEDKYKKYGLNIDESLIISTIFYGYDEQAGYGVYEDPESVKFVPASEHYQLLENILSGGDDALLKKDDVDRIIKSTIFEEVWPYWRWQKVAKLDSSHNKYYTIRTELSDFEFDETWTSEQKIKEIIKSLREEFYPISGTYSFTMEGILEYNGYTPESLAIDILAGATGIVIKAPVLTGQCVYYEHIFFYYSKEKWEMFIRFNDGGNEAINDFGIPGFVGSYGKGGAITRPIIDRGDKLFDGGKFNYDLSTLYGSGWVYDTNMNNSWLNSSEPCNGTLSDSQILSKFGVDLLEKTEKGSKVADANNFFKKREFTSTLSTFIYTQKINEEDLYTLTKDKMVSINRKYTDSSINDGGSVKTTEFTFEYKYGYAYVGFPGFKMASDKGLQGFVYNDITTPKKIEVIVQNIIDRKDEFDEVLGIDTLIKDYEEGNPLNVGSYCNQTQREGVGHYEVIINDCEGNYMATRSFKEYIIGVAYGEVGFPDSPMHIEYTKAQLVASISYTLGRRKNYLNSKVFTMRSGSCDQNWCDIYLGCSRSDVGGFLREDGSILLATYPGSFKYATTTKTCTVNGATAKNYWQCPMSSAQIAKYSELFDEAYKYVIAKSNEGSFYQEGMPTDDDLQATGFNGAYASVMHGKWLQKSLEGKDVETILTESYPNSTIYNCAEIAGTEERTSYDWPHVNEYGSAADPNEQLCVNYNSNYDDTWNKKIIEVAYRLAGSTVGDCSTFVRKAIRVAASELGIPTPGTMSTSTGMFKRYGRCNCAMVDDLKMGDIVFHRTNPARWKNVGHVAIFMGYNDEGKQMVFESNTGKSTRATGSRDKPALVVDNNTYRIAGYSRWYPPDMSESECKSYN